MKTEIKELMLNTMREIIASEGFKNHLIEINENFFNLKQESHIRNTLLIHLNRFFKEKGLGYHAISEHPRVNHKRIDLSIVDMNHHDAIYKIEFKFQLVGDYKKTALNIRSGEIDYDFNEKEADLFVLIVIEWDDLEKLAYDKKSGLEKSLTLYNRGQLSKWSEEVDLLLTRFSNTEYYKNPPIELSQPYKTIYHFNFLSKSIKTAQKYEGLFDLIPSFQKIGLIELNDQRSLKSSLIEAMNPYMQNDYMAILEGFDRTNQKIEKLNELQLLAFLTESIRLDRFVGGHLSEMIESGQILLALQSLQNIIIS